MTELTDPTITSTAIVDNADQAAMGREEPRCDHICLRDDGHVERGEPHFYGYELPSPRSLDKYLRRIMASPGWSGSVVIEVTPDEGVSISWRTEEQGKEWEDYGPDATGHTVLTALAVAARDADALGNGHAETPPEPVENSGRDTRPEETP